MSRQTRLGSTPSASSAHRQARCGRHLPAGRSWCRASRCRTSCCSARCSSTRLSSCTCRSAHAAAAVSYWCSTRVSRAGHHPVASRLPRGVLARGRPLAAAVCATHRQRASGRRRAPELARMVAAPIGQGQVREQGGAAAGGLVGRLHGSRCAAPFGSEQSGPLTPGRCAPFCPLHPRELASLLCGYVCVSVWCFVCESV